MIIAYRDELGAVEVEAASVSFFYGYAWFTTSEGFDLKIPVENVVEIRRK